MDIDPKEVLAHLNQMGYYNITGLQLKEFIKDLRKLILYEQRNQGVEERAVLSTTSQSPEEVTASRKSHKTTCSRWNDKSNGNGNNSKDADISSSSTDSGRQVSPISPRKRPNTADSEKSLSDRNHRSILRSRENLAPTLSKSSFIRPRELTGQRPGSAPQKSDPVALYHHYKQLWEQQKRPGEESHANLRWTVREKMMGQEPQARPVSQSSSVRLRKRPEWI